MITTAPTNEPWDTLYNSNSVDKGGGGYRGVVGGWTGEAGGQGGQGVGGAEGERG